MIYEKDHAIAQVFITNKLSDIVHLHNEFEIICCVKGSFVAVIDSVEYTVNEGQSIISFPNQIHYYLCDNNKNYKFYVLIFTANVFNEYSRNVLSQIPENPILNHITDYPLLTKRLAEMENDTKHPTEFSTLKRVGNCKLICAEIFQKCKFIPVNKSNPDTLSSIVDFCNNNYTNDIHLCDLAESLHINKYYISHLFKDKFKMGFNEYIHTLRISKACKLLAKTDDPITVISSNVGYNTVRNFNRIFIKIMKMTPSEYRMSKGSKN